MSAPPQHLQAVLLERTSRKRRAPQEENAGLVEELHSQLTIPVPPAGDGLFRQRRVRLVGAILEPHDLADVGGCRERMRQRPRIDEAHGMPAPSQLDRRGNPEDTRASHGDPVHAIPLLPSAAAQPDLPLCHHRGAVGIANLDWIY